MSELGVDVTLLVNEDAIGTVRRSCEVTATERCQWLTAANLGDEVESVDVVLKQLRAGGNDIGVVSVHLTDQPVVTNVAGEYAGFGQ